MEGTVEIEEDISANICCQMAAYDTSTLYWVLRVDSFSNYMQSSTGMQIVICSFI